MFWQEGRKQLKFTVFQDFSIFSASLFGVNVNGDESVIGSVFVRKEEERGSLVCYVLRMERSESHDIEGEEYFCTRL